MRVAAVLILVTLAAAPPARAGDLLEFEKHVRSTDPSLRAQIRDARAASPTFRRLIARLERSDVIVYVTRHYDMSPTLDGQITFTASAGGVRYLNIRLAWDLPPQRLAATLAHELQHAVEIADAEDVVDEASMARAYARMGEPAAINARAYQAFETREAIDIAQRVWREYGASSADD
jgi:hypothetical protein